MADDQTRRLIDRFGRRLDYLRISVTDRCNLRCAYCMPLGGIEQLKRQEMLSFEEIAEVARSAADRGVTKLRITGGEPLVRKHLPRLVELLAKIPGVEDLSMTTNGVLLAQWAKQLAEAGLQRVNVSLDTVDPDRYRAITCGGELRDVLAGIEAARSVGLLPVKLNCVVEESAAEPDAEAVARFAREHKLEVRYIMKMNLAQGAFSIVEGGAGGDCPKCNRLRLTSNGSLKPCLFSDISFNVRELGVEEALSCAVEGKPEAGTSCRLENIHSIGG